MIQVGSNAYIPYSRYQVKPHSSPWLSAAFPADIARINHFFPLHKTWTFPLRISSVNVIKSAIWSHLLTTSLMKNFRCCAVFVCTNRTNLLHLKWSSVIFVKEFLKLPNSFMLTKEKIEKSLSPCRNLTLTTFWRISNSDFSKGKSIPPPLFYIPEVLPSRSD